MQTWQKRSQNIMGTWPAARFGHAAVSLYNPDKDPENPAMVLIGGCSQGDIHNDAWLFNVNTLKWRKVRDWYTNTFEPSMNVTNLFSKLLFFSCYCQWIQRAVYTIP